MEDGKRCSCVITRNGVSGIRWHAGFPRGGEGGGGGRVRYQSSLQGGSTCLNFNFLYLLHCKSGVWIALLSEYRYTNAPPLRKTEKKEVIVLCLSIG